LLNILWFAQTEKCLSTTSSLSSWNCFRKKFMTRLHETKHLFWQHLQSRILFTHTCVAHANLAFWALTAALFVSQSTADCLFQLIFFPCVYTYIHTSVLACVQQRDIKFTLILLCSLEFFFKFIRTKLETSAGKIAYIHVYNCGHKWLNCKDAYAVGEVAQFIELFCSSSISHDMYGCAAQTHKLFSIGRWRKPQWG
jgi:hypothetical protein